MALHRPIARPVGWWEEVERAGAGVREEERGFRCVIKLKAGSDKRCEGSLAGVCTVVAPASTF